MQTVASSETMALLQAQGRADAQLWAVRQRYASRYAVALLLPTIAAGLLLWAVAHHWPLIHPLGIVAAALLILGVNAWFASPLRHINRTLIAQRLDRQYPELEDSTGLLLQNPTALPLLGRLQYLRTAQRLEELLAAAGPGLLPFSLKTSGLLSAGLLVLAALGGLPPARPFGASPQVALRFRPDPARPAAAPTPARITATRLFVTPPAYTRQAAFAPAQASFSCPQGARVRWIVAVSRAVQPLPALEIGAQTLRLRPVPGQPTTFFAEQTLQASALYRLRYAGQVSDDYAIEVRPDQAPVVHIQTPKPYTLIAAVGTRPEVPVQATLRDDYGLRRAELVLTVAQGQGEAVKFREVRRDLSASLGGQPTRHSINQLLDLPRLGLTYGDELYFYVQAQDSHGQRARSDTYLVQWQDTAAATSALDMGMGVNTAPAYFRSQRQIIIDTEKLLAEKSKLTPTELSNRANALGFDQQSLRLRYGKFLGEESEKGMGASAPSLPIAEEEDAPKSPLPTAEADHDEHAHEHAAAPAKRGTLPSPTAETDELMEPYMHKHDDAETADFLEPAVKAKLHAVLDEMWAAELRLRTGQLAAARPYEYRALRLLKEVQQQTRAYVRKAGFTPQPLPEATLRLTGELKGAAAPQLRTTISAPTGQPAVRAALRWLAAATAGQRGQSADAAQLAPAGQLLAQAALQKPGAYLPALRALRTLAADAHAGRVPCASCLPVAERALTDLLPLPAPAAAPTPAPDRLARRYFQALGQ